MSRELGVTGARIRNFLRLAWPRPDIEKGSPWILSHDQVQTIRNRFSGEARIPSGKHQRVFARVRAGSDEAYVIDLCEQILREKAQRQHRFSFLRSDAGTTLPVDAYFTRGQVVVEYRERQHLAERPDSFTLWDNKPTISGVNRREQRARYDRLREELLPQNGIELIVIQPDDLRSNKRGRLVRDRDDDLKKLVSLLGDRRRERKK